jgi:hypothetical protein
MSQSWSLYAPVTIAVAERAVADMYKALAAVVGPDLAEHLEPGEELEPPELGLWPEVSVPQKSVIPSVGAPGGAKKAAVNGDEAALARLATCTASIDIEHPNDFDPALVTALRALIASLGPCVFSGGEGSELTTSESLITKLETSLDLAAALRKLAAGESIGEEDEEEEEDDEDEDEDEPAPDSARPEMLRMLLGEIAQQPRIRRKVSELLGNAPPLVASVAERLARIGAETDAVAAKALAVTEADVAAARKTLATIFRRAENR